MVRREPPVLRRIRESRGATQSQVARAVGVSPSCISHLEAGRSSVSVRVLHQILQALGATPAERSAALESVATWSAA